MPTETVRRIEAIPDHCLPGAVLRMTAHLPTAVKRQIAGQLNAAAMRQDHPERKGAGGEDVS